MKKIIYTLALVSVIGLCSCGQDSSSGSSDSTDLSTAADVTVSDSTASVPDKSVDLKAAAESLIKGDSDLTKTVFYTDKIFEQGCKNLYGCERSELDDALVLYNAGGGMANEISILRRKDGNTDTALEALKARAEQRYKDFDGYVPEELPKIEDARIFAVDSYAVLIISDKAATLEAAIRDILNT